MAKRSAALELAVFGVLAQNPAHGYELRKRLVSVFGLFNTISYGALYPTLKSLVERGLIAEQDENPDSPYRKRTRIVYTLTEAGQQTLAQLVSDNGPNAWDDELFAIRMSLFSQTASDTRIHILQGRRSRIEERLDQLQRNLAKGRERLDSYTLELQQHGLDALEREVRWLNELIAREEAGAQQTSRKIPSKPKSAKAITES
ncbi:MAG: PadR family transcriptional regulator [Actinomycetales bacterium]|nr:PadR family transcriptional regulator [Actinomycetales bacterium]